MKLTEQLLLIIFLKVDWTPDKTTNAATYWALHVAFFFFLAISHGLMTDMIRKEFCKVIEPVI